MKAMKIPNISLNNKVKSPIIFYDGMPLFCQAQLALACYHNVEKDLDNLLTYY